MHLHVSTIDSIFDSANVISAEYRLGRIGPIGFGEVKFLSDWTVETDDVGENFYLHLPLLQGRFRSDHDGVYLLPDDQKTAIYRPGTGPFRGGWASGYFGMCVGIERVAIDAALGRLLGGRMPRRVTFDTLMDISSGPGRTWAGMMMTLRRYLHTPDGLLSNPIVSEPMAESLIAGFLLATSHSYAEELKAPVRAAMSTAVRKAMDLIEAEPQAPWTVAQLADRCGVSVRALQSGFRRHLDVTPLAYLRNVRLGRAHDELHLANPFEETVASIARRWGFNHLGRFAAMHEERYGQKPSEILRD
ncbi:AraC family transcriptional regulator [Streptomyces sp. NPDC057062]|uniref:helix-turn-helix transcriptional regulator n=1 Tax=Streptomyces sp. NPDC057062 TaxID=3346011 RepID=UPI0036417E10